METSDDESQLSDTGSWRSNSSYWITKSLNSDESMNDSDESGVEYTKAMFAAYEENRYKSNCELLNKLMKSTNPKDKETLNASVIEILKNDYAADLQYLIKNQAIDFRAKDYSGLTVLSLAASLSSIKVVKTILEHMTDFDVERYNQENLLTLEISHELPTLVYVENAINIVHLLQNKNITLTLKNKLGVLRFLLHDVDDCKCWDAKNRMGNMELLMCYGSLTHIEHIVNKFENEISRDYGSYLSTPLSGPVLLELYVDEDTKNFVEDLTETSIDSHPFKFHHNLEWKWLHSTKIRNNLNLKEVLSKHPHEIYEYVKDLDFHELCKDYNSAGQYMKGLKAKSLIRHQLEEFLPDFVGMLLPLLPDLCFDNIMSYVIKFDNEDLLNVCKAAVLEEDETVN